MGRRRPSLLSYHCSDALVATGRLSMTTVTYDPLLQCLFVVVFVMGKKIYIFTNILFNSLFDLLTMLCAPLSYLFKLVTYFKKTSLFD
jgi:hypothetical protein